jgi:hypothetical protein
MVDSSEASDLASSPLSWLADAPLFLDAEQVTAFYDAILRPEFDTGVIRLSKSEMRAKRTSLEGGLSGEVSTSALVKKIFPFLDAKVSGSAKRLGERSKKQETSDTIELHEISTSQRQLIQLALHYIADLPGRVVHAVDDSISSWRGKEYIKSVPRALVFLEISEETIIIPAAAELNEGRVITFFDKLIPALSGKSNTIPEDFPSDHSGSDDALREARLKYWKWYADNFDSHKAMTVVESAIFESRGRVRWIDFRVLLGQSGDAVQLHMAGREQYDTGVFAYNLIRRGYRHGLRVVGTLKSGPDLNVLAVFER